MQSKIIPTHAHMDIISIATENQEHRFTLKREWEPAHKKAVVIGINPSKATHLKGDNTTTNAMNYLIDENYGSMTMVNLYSYRTSTPIKLETNSRDYKTNNYEYIKQECKKADLIIVAWGYDKEKYKNAKEDVRKILYAFKAKVKCFEKDGIKPQHLRTFSEEFKLVNFFD